MVFLFQILIVSGVLGFLNEDDDLRVRTTATLESNSTEIFGNRLMPIGTWTYWEQPILDTGTFQHEITRLDFSNIQWNETITTTEKDHFSKTDFYGNESINSSEVQEYGVSAGFGTTISANVQYNYSYNVDNLTSLETIEGSHTGVISDTEEDDDSHLTLISEGRDYVDTISPNTGSTISGNLTSLQSDDGDILQIRSDDTTQIWDNVSSISKNGGSDNDGDIDSNDDDYYEIQSNTQTPVYLTSFTQNTGQHSGSVSNMEEDNGNYFNMASGSMNNKDYGYIPTSYSLEYGSYIGGVLSDLSYKDSNYFTIESYHISGGIDWVKVNFIIDYPAGYYYMFFDHEITGGSCVKSVWEFGNIWNSQISQDSAPTNFYGHRIYNYGRTEVSLYMKIYGINAHVKFNWLRMIPIGYTVIDYEFDFDYNISPIDEYSGSIIYKTDALYDGTFKLEYYDTSWHFLKILSVSTTDSTINFNFESSVFPKFRIIYNLASLENPFYTDFRISVDKFILYPLENIIFDYRFSFDDSSSIDKYQVNFRYKVESGTVAYLKYSADGGLSFITLATLSSMSEVLIDEEIESAYLPIIKVYLNENPHFDTRKIYIDQLIISPLEWSDIDYRFEFNVEDPTFQKDGYNFDIFLKYKCSVGDRIQISVFTDNGWEYYQTLTSTSYVWYNFSVYSDFLVAYPIVRFFYGESQNDDYYDTTDFFIEELTILSYKRTLDYTLNLPYTNKTSVDNIYNISIIYSSSDVDLCLQYENSNGWIDLTSLHSTNKTVYSTQITSDINPIFRLFYNGGKDHNPININIDKFNITSKYHPFLNVYVQNFTYVCVATYTKNYTININPSLCSYNWQNGTEVWFFGSDYMIYYTGISDLTVLTQNITYIFTVAFMMDINISFSLDYASMCWKTPTDVNLRVNDYVVIDTGIDSGYIYLTEYPDILIITSDVNVLFEMNISTTFFFEFDLDIKTQTHLRKDFKLLSNHKITITIIEYISDEIQILESRLKGISFGNNNPFYPNFIMNPNDVITLDVILSIQTPMSRELKYLYGSLGSGSVNLYLMGITSSYDYDDMTRFDSFNLLIPEGFNLNSADLNFSDMKYTPAYETNESENIHSTDHETQSFSQEDVNWMAYFYYTSKKGLYYLEYSPMYNYLEWIEDFSDFETWMHHYFYPNDQSFNGSGYNFGSLNMYNQFPHNLYTEEFTDWYLNYYLPFSNSSFNNGNLSSYLNTGFDTTLFSQFYLDFVNGTYDNGNLHSSDYGYAYDYGSVHPSYWYLKWLESFSALQSWMHHTYFPNDQSFNGSSYNVGSFDMYNRFPHDFYTESFTDWYKNYNLLYTDTDFIDGNFSSYLNTGDHTYVPDQSQFDFIYGLIDSTGTLDVLDDNYYTFNSTETGHFPATYSFEGDLDGSNPAGFTTAEANAGDVQVIASRDDHKKVVKVIGDVGANTGIIQTFAIPQETGTVELWFEYVDLGSDESYIQIRGNVERVMIAFRFGVLYAWNGLVETLIMNPAPTGWTHFKIVISADTYDLYVDDVLEANDFAIRSDEDPNSFTYIEMFVPSWRTESNIYIDAIGYSWNTNYDIGDNYFWQFYPATFDFESNNISTSGDHYGSWSFKNDACGSNPEGWGVIEGAGAGTLQVISEFQGHKKVVEFYDTGVNAVHLYQTSASHGFNPTSGVIDFWIAGNSSAKEFPLEFKNQDNVVMIRIYIGYNDNIQYYNYTSGSWEIACSFSANQWYHIGIDFDCGTDTYDLYVNGIKELDDVVFGTVATTLSEIRFFPSYSHADMKWYINAIGYSWRSDYSQWDNCNPYGRPVDISTFIDVSSVRCGTSVAVSGEFAVHKKFLNLTDNSGTDKVYIYDNFTAQTTTGTIELWMKSLDNSKQNSLIISWGVGLNLIVVMRSTGQWSYYTASWVYNDLGSYNSDQWYHVRIDFDVITDTFDLYVDEVLLGSDLAFRSPANQIDRIQFETDAGSSGYSFYVDAIGYSWDSDYNIGGNTIPDNYPRLNFSINHQLTWGNNTIEFLNFSYAYYTDLFGQEVNLSIYDFENNQWVLVNISFHDDIASGYWDLSDVGTRYFLATIPDSGNYLLDNYTTTTDEYYYSETYFDVANPEGVYTGITWDGTHFWVIEDTNDEVYQYTSAGVYTGIHFDVGTEDTSPQGITWDGTHFWVIGYTNKEVYQYNSTGNYTETHWDVGARDYYPEDITWDGTYFLVIGDINDEVFQYTSAGVYTGTHWDLRVETEDTLPRGITWDGTHFWVVGDLNDEVYQYTSAGVYTGIHFDVGTEDTSPQGITWNGTHFWVIGDTNDKVYQYDEYYRISKNYYGSGYAYMQTSTTETLNLISPEYSDINAWMGDYFIINCKTTSSKEIKLKLIKDDSIIKEFVVIPEGNTDFDNQIVNIDLENNLIFDQLMFSGELNNTKYFKCYDIELNFINWINETSYSHQELDFLNESNYIYLKLESYNYTTDFSLFMDVFKVYYNWTKTSGDIFATIEKNIDYPEFMDLYDSDGDYQKLYNITLSFQYRFMNDTYYNYTLDHNNSINLNKDGNWYHYNESFIYDSQSLGGFNITFEISNGLLELKDLNYTIWFICKGNSIDLYQLLTVDNQETISDYASENAIFIINTTYIFTNTTDLYISNYSNGIDSSQLRIQYNLYGLNTGWHTYSYMTNISESLEKTFNATYHLDNDYSDTLKNFTIDYYLLGNSTELNITNLVLYENRTILPSELNLTLYLQLTDMNNTIEFLNLTYAYFNSLYHTVNLSIYDYKNSNWVLLNSSANNISAYVNNWLNYTSYSDQWIDFLNDSNYILFRIETGYNYTTNFTINVNNFDVYYNWTKTSGNISATIEKNIDYPEFMDLYDSDSDYQKLYNITLSYQYKFSNDTFYNYDSSFNNTYFATHTFTDDLGKSESDIPFIIDNDGDSNCIVTVIQNKDEHEYILDFYDNNNGGYGIWHNNFADQNSGTITFFIYFEDNTNTKTIGFIDDGMYGVKLEWKGDGKLYYDDDTGDHEIESYVANYWYKIKIDFDCGTDTYDIYIDGVLKEVGVSYDQASTDGIDEFCILSDASDSDYHFYLDAIDYGWDSTFNVWKTYNYTFIYNSQSSGGFNISFKIENGLLEVKDFNYTIWFICEGNSIDLYQLLTVDNQFDISDYHSGIGIFTINITYDFTNTTDLYISNYSNGIDSSQLRIQYNLYGLNTGWHTYSYMTNISESLEKTFNATYNLNNDFSDTLKNFTIDFYLLGNSTELTLYNITLYDHDLSFDFVNEVSINDAYLCSNQYVEIMFNGTDPHISHFTLNQTYSPTGIETTIYNLSISNNVSYTWNFNNNSAGNYSLWFIFYDKCGNYEEWVINITIRSPVSISVGYENPIYVNQNGSINVNMYSDYYINESYYSNSSDYIQYSNSQSYNITFDFDVIFNETQYYNISVKALTEYGDKFYVNITDLFVKRRGTILDFIYFTEKVYQDKNAIFDIELSETYEYQGLSNTEINYTLTAPNGTILYNSSTYTNSSGLIRLSYLLSIAWIQGFYNLNISFMNTSNQYLYYWKMWSFEVLPIMRIITDSTDVNLTVNDVLVGNDNYIQLNESASETMELNIYSIDDFTFDLFISNIIISFTGDYDYIDYIDVSFEFNRTASFSSLTITDIELSNIPINFSLYYLNDILSSNYDFNIYTQEIIPTGLIGETMYEDETFNIKLRYKSGDRIKTQITSNPTTDVDSVIFTEIYYVDYPPETPIAYNYWYFVDNYDINSVELYHQRTSDTIENSDVFKDGNCHHLIKESLDGDLFESTLDYNPNWDISYSFIEQTSTYSKVKIDYKSDFNIKNVSTILDLIRGDCFSNLTLNKNQSSEQISIIIPNINFTTTTQTLYIEGFRTQKTLDSTTNLGSAEFNEEFRYGTLSLINNTIDINPNYYVSYDVITNNGTYSKINVDYKADLNVDNINVSIDLSAYSLYNENWTHNAEQSSTTFILKVPYLDFTSSIQTISLEGYSSVPNSSFNYYKNEETFIICEENYSVPIYYRGYLTFNKYSTAFFVKDLSNSWTMDGVHYLNNYYTINTTTGFFRCEGFDPSISSAYLRFKAIPISNITRVVNSTGVITYIIDCDFPIDNAILMFTIEESNRFTLESPDDDVLELYDINDMYYYYYLNLDLEAGINYFVIRYTIHTLADDLVYLIPLLVIIGIVLILYWRTRRKEKKKKQIEKEKKWYEFWKWRLNVKEIKNIKNQGVKYMKNIKRKGGKKR